MRWGVLMAERCVGENCVWEGCIKAQGGVRSRCGASDSRLYGRETSSGLGGLWRAVLVAIVWKTWGE